MRHLVRLAASVAASIAYAALAGPLAVAAAQSTERVSVGLAGAQANSDSAAPATSADGRYVAFTSRASNLVAGDTNGQYDVFVYDRQAGTTERVSVSSAGAQGNDTSDDASISADGRYVAFMSAASTLVPGDTNGALDVFVRDRQTATTTRVSVSSAGVAGNGFSAHPAISADGRYVAFESGATNLVAGDTNGISDVFVRDRTASTTTRVSVAGAATQSVGDEGAFRPAMSADGRYVAFESDATNLVAGDTNDDWDVFVRDRTASSTTRVSVAGAATQGDAASVDPSISSDGRYVAFESLATNLVAGDTNNAQDVFVRDRTAAATTRVSVSSAGVQGNAESLNPAISADGRIVAFESLASNLVALDLGLRTNVFARDRTTSQTQLVSGGYDGSAGDNTAGEPATNADGRFVAFSSFSTNMVAGDTNAATDIFVRDRKVPAEYADLVLADLPVGYWRLGERSGTVVGDASPNANRGTYLGGVTLGVPGALTGDADRAASFDGVNDLARIPDSNSLDVGDSFTIEGWVRRSSNTLGATLALKGANGLQLSLGAGDQVLLRKANVSTIAHSAGGVPADGAFHQVAATKNGTSVAIYIDGQPDTVLVSPAQVVANTTSTLDLGAFPAVRNDLDEFALYDRALTAPEVKAHFDLGRLGP